VDDPFRPGCTIYATGDLVRINPIDHSSIYLDRRDTQIKIHGLRVEAGEIETVLKAASKTVSNAAVTKVEVERECLVAFMEYPMDIQTGEVKMVHDDSFGSLLMSLRCRSPETSKLHGAGDLCCTEPVSSRSSFVTQRLRNLPCSTTTSMTMMFHQ
jgi:hypothetical protein